VIPVTVVTAALPASASGKRLCEAYSSNHYCLGSNNTDYYTAIVTKSTGRDLVATPLGTEYDGLPTYLLQFSAVAADCVGVTNDLSHADIKPCNGGTGIVWAKWDLGNGKYRWINRYASQNSTQVQYLTGKNTLDDWFFTANYNACCGDYQVFEWKS